MSSAEHEKWRSCPDVMVAPGRIPNPGYFNQLFALQEGNLVPLVAPRHSQVVGIFYFTLPPPHGLPQNSFSENKLSIDSTMKHHALEDYFVSNVCQSHCEGLT